MIKTHKYDMAEYPFRESIEMMLGTPNLEGLHRMGGVPIVQVKPGSDNHTIWHNKFYTRLAESGFMDIYNAKISFPMNTKRWPILHY